MGLRVCLDGGKTDVVTFAFCFHQQRIVIGNISSDHPRCSCDSPEEARTYPLSLPFLRSAMKIMKAKNRAAVKKRQR